MSSFLLLATDLDGTLLHDRENITGYDRTMLHYLKQQHVIIAFATGRDLRLVTPMLDRLSLWDAVDYIIHSGGCGLYHVKEKKNQILAQHSVQTLQDMYLRYQHLPLSFLITQDETMYTSRINPTLIEDSKLLECPLIEISEFQTILTKPNEKLVLCGDTQHIQEAIAILEQDYDPRYEFHQSHSNYIDGYARGIHKGSAIRYLCQMLDIPLNKTLAIGDHLNDLQMLTTAQYTACPAEAHPALLELVQYVTCPAKYGAVADACAHFLFDFS